jgi:D-alanyl-D-alanine endopeptidase (penicillin-binding protein 7)
MTALVVLDAQLPLDEKVIITRSDARLEKNPPSRLPVGARLTRGELLHLALMSSENRAAQALGRSYPGGLSGFVRAMNVKAVKLGMASSRFTEPTGLNAGNVSSPRDLIRLVEEAYLHPEIRRYSTAKQLSIKVRGRTLQFRNSNALVRADRWDLGLSKTGFIRDAGRCLVMQAEVESRPAPRSRCGDHSQGSYSEGCCARRRRSLQNRGRAVVGPQSCLDEVVERRLGLILLGLMRPGSVLVQQSTVNG